MLFERLRRTVDAIARSDAHGLIEVQAERIERYLRDGEITFPQWANLMSALLAPSCREPAYARA